MKGSKLDWMPLKVDIFLGGTTMFSAAEVGGYLLLLMAQWSGGPLPSDKKLLKRIAKVNANQLNNILSKFEKQTDGTYINIVCEKIKAAQIEKYENQSNKGKHGAESRWRKHSTGNACAMPESVAKQCLTDGRNHSITKIESTKNKEIPKGISTHTGGGVLLVEDFERQGYQFGQLSADAKRALNEFLIYRAGPVQKSSITNGSMVEAIVRELSRLPQSMWVDAVNLTIARGAKHIIINQPATSGQAKKPALPTDYSDVKEA